MKNFFAPFIATLLIIQSIQAQKLKTFKDHCGLYYETMADLLQQKEAELNFYQFKPGQVVGSIGAQCSHWEAAFAAATDSIVFYLEDIDPVYFTEKQISFAWDYYEQLRGKPMSSTWIRILGDEKKTNLPDNLFDKLIIINSFHEFSFQDEMLKDIARKLKPGGLLYIDEALARKSGELHGVCKKKIYLDQELIDILNQNRFDYVNGLNKNFRKKNIVRKIFAFRKK